MTFRGHYAYVNCCWLIVQDKENTFFPFSYVLWLTLMNSPCRELGIRVGGHVVQIIFQVTFQIILSINRFLKA